MSNGSWQPDPYGRHQMRWWDGAQWTSMVSNGGVTADENALPTQMQPPPMQQPPMQQPMGMGAPSSVVLQPTPPKQRNNVLIAVVAAVVLLAAGVVVFLVTRDNGGGGKVTSATATTVATTGSTGSTGTTLAGGTTLPPTSVAGGTGHDSQTPAGQAYVDAMMQTSGESGFTTDEARCVAAGAVDIVGVQALKDAGVTPEMVAAGSDLLPNYTPTEAQAAAMIDMMFGCVDFGQLMADQMGGSALPADQVKCIGDALETNTAFRQFMITSIISSSTDTTVTTDTTAEATLTSVLLGIFTTCGVDPGSLGG